VGGVLQENRRRLSPMKKKKGRPNQYMCPGSIGEGGGTGVIGKQGNRQTWCQRSVHVRTRIAIKRQVKRKRQQYEAKLPKDDDPAPSQKKR